MIAPNTVGESYTIISNLTLFNWHPLFVHVQQQLVMPLAAVYSVHEKKAHTKGELVHIAAGAVQCFA